MQKHQMDLLALACPRSATRYLKKILRCAGMKVGHESFKRRGTVGMMFAVEDSIYPGKHWSDEHEWRQRRSHYDFKQVWHFTRDPRNVISSLASKYLPSNVWIWQERHTGIDAGLWPKELRAMLFWVAWNELIEKNEKINFRFRIEDIDLAWPEICSRLSIEDRPDVPSIDRDYGTFERGQKRIQPLRWNEMLDIDPKAAYRVRTMAERYGYDLDSPIEDLEVST